MKVIVFMQKELEDWWGVEDLLEDNADLSSSEKTRLIVELLMEDFPALLDGAKWKVARVSDEQPKQSWSGSWRGEEWGVEK